MQNDTDAAKRMPEEMAGAFVAGRVHVAKRNRIYVVAALLPGAVAILAMIFSPFWPADRLYITPSRYIPSRALLVIVATLLLVSIASFVVLYLQTGFRRHLYAPTDFRDWPPREAADSHRPLVGDQQRSGIEMSVPQSEDERFHDISRYTDEMIWRLSKAVDEQGRRNNSNLGFGFFITMVGIIVLVYFVHLQQEINPAEPWAILTFVPRLSLVVLIELFAYFFLSLYRDGLAEVKYFQNELINVRIRTLGLRTVIRENDKDGTRHIAKAFGDTDRNLSSKSTSSSGAPDSAEILKTAQEIVKLANKLTSTGGKAE